MFSVYDILDVLVVSRYPTIFCDILRYPAVISQMPPNRPTTFAGRNEESTNADPEEKKDSGHLERSADRREKRGRRRARVARDALPRERRSQRGCAEYDSNDRPREFALMHPEAREVCASARVLSPRDARKTCVGARGRAGGRAGAVHRGDG